MRKNSFSVPTIVDLETPVTSTPSAAASSGRSLSSPHDYFNSDFSATETEYQKFSRLCGLDGNTRIYGDLEISGTVANLKYNRFLKRSGTENPNPSRAASDAASLSSTQEAFYVTIDKEALALARTRDINVIGALPEKYDTTFRVKEIKYGNHNAMWEILSGQLYGLTGMTAPDTRFLVHDGYGLRPNGAPKVFVASPTITGYIDLGDFLIDHSIQRFIKEEDFEFWQETKQKIEAINNLTKVEGGKITAQDKLERLRLMEEIYKILPNYFHTEIEKAFAASKFIANWDFANFSLNNIGCKFTLDKDGNVVGFESVFVDFGNSGANGFGGQYKELSLNRANSEAKSVTIKPKDYDPALAFTPEELALIEARAKEIAFTDHYELEQIEELTEEEWKTKTNEAINSLVEDLLNIETENQNLDKNAISLRRSIRFKATHHILPHEASMEVNPSTTGFLTFSDLPRNLPFGFLLAPALQAKTKAAVFSPQYHNHDSESKPLHLEKSLYRDSEIEAAYRLSLIPDEAILKVVRKWYLCEEFPNIFPIPEGFRDNPKYTTAEGVAEIFKERRNNLVQSIPTEIINEWISQNKAQALAAKYEVELALLKKTTIPNQDFHKNPQNSLSNSLLIAEIIAENPADTARKILILVKTFQREFDQSDFVKRELQEIRELEEELSQNTREKTRLLLEDEINLKKSEIDQKKMEMVLDFINANSQIWKISLELDSKPNCNPFNLNLFKEMYHITNNSTSQLPNNDRQAFTEDRLKTNQNLHQANCFAYEQFTKILEEISKPLECIKPTTEPLHNTTSTLKKSNSLPFLKS